MINKNSLLTIILSVVFTFSLFSETIEYTVQSGDTLYSISKKYDVSVDEIMKNNNISSPNQLKMGIILQISQISLDYNANNWYIKDSEYYVEKGDTLYSISRRNGISVSDLLKINNLPENYVLHIGEKLLLNKDIPVQDGGQHPIAEAVESTYSENILFWPISGTRYKMEGKLEGIRINAEAFSYVRSIAAGKVVLAEPYRGFGNVILIDVNGYIYLYGGNEDIFVNVGEEVTAGTRIGRLGMSDMENGMKDMFFSVFKDGKPVDINTAPRG